MSQNDLTEGTRVRVASQSGMNGHLGVITEVFPVAEATGEQWVDVQLDNVPNGVPTDWCFRVSELEKL